MIDPSITPSWPTVKAKVRVTGAPWTLDDDSYVFLADTKSKMVSAVKALRKMVKLAEPDWVMDEVNNMNSSARAKELK